MKIHQLPDGARFEYKGAVFVKTGPMFGTGPHGPQLIPRAAVLQPLGESEATSATASNRIAKATIENAFSAFYADCQALVPEERQGEMALLRERFLTSIDSAA